MFHILQQDRVPSSFTQQLSTFPWFDSSVLNNQYKTQSAELSAVFFHEKTGNAFMYVQADEALAAGQLVYATLPTADTVTSASSTVYSVYLTSTTLTAHAEIDNWLYCENGGTDPTIKLIKENTANLCTISQLDQNSTVPQYDPDVLSTALTNGTGVAVIRPGHVSVCTATAVPIGVALATVTIHYYTLIQVAGLALIQATGNGTALVSGKPAVPDAAGIIIGMANQGVSPTAVINLYVAGASIVPKFAFVGAGPELIPCDVNFFNNL